MKFILSWEWLVICTQAAWSGLTEYLVMQMFTHSIVPVLKEEKKTDCDTNQHDGLQPTPDAKQPPTVMKMSLKLNRDLL